MKKFLISLFSILYIFLLSFPISINEVYASDELVSPITINQSVDEDLKSFNFDYEKYQVNPELVYRPIIVNFNESTSKDYMDLLYVYDPNNVFDLAKIRYTINYGVTEDCLDFKENIINKMYLSGKSSDGTFKRYAINGYIHERDNYNFRLYTITYLEMLHGGGFNVNDKYLFEKSTGLTYSNCMNIRLEDPHNWSWHFDEDTTGWEAFKDWWTGTDVLHDQLFYSFYIPKGWDVKNIESIDLKYKKVFLSGYRHNIADTGIKHEFYQNVNDEIYKPNFLTWDYYPSYDGFLNIRKLLGHSISEIGNKVEYTFDTIIPDVVTSNGLIHEYTWNKIQNIDSFKKAFGVDSDIYKFAMQYMTEENENYWIINYDDYEYSYEEKVIKNIEYNGFGFVEDEFEENDLLIDYLKSHGVEQKSAGYSYNYYLCYSFTEEYTFDISATSITYVDGLNVTRTLPTSVVPVMEKEGSGGDSETVGEYFEHIINEKKRDFKRIIKIIAFILLGIIIFWLIRKIIKLIADVKTIKNKK